VNLKFTAHLENELDEIAESKLKWTEAIKEFWFPYKKELDKAQETVEKINTDVETDIKCDLCGKPMVIKQGRFGEFLACTGFPECRNTKALPKKDTGIKCPKCSEGDVVERRTKKGRTFWGCSRYPECDYATWNKPGLEKKEED
jgi:DNA topoisomerase-1